MRPMAGDGTVACADRSKSVSQVNYLGNVMFSHSLFMSWCWNRNMIITRTSYTQNTSDNWVCWDKTSGPTFQSRYGKGYSSWTGISSSDWRCGLPWVGGASTTLTVRIDAKAGGSSS